MSNEVAAARAQPALIAALLLAASDGLLGDAAGACPGARPTAAPIARKRPYRGDRSTPAPRQAAIHPGPSHIGRSLSISGRRPKRHVTLLLRVHPLPR